MPPPAGGVPALAAWPVGEYLSELRLGEDAADTGLLDDIGERLTDSVGVPAVRVCVCGYGRGCGRGSEKADDHEKKGRVARRVPLKEAVLMRSSVLAGILSLVVRRGNCTCTQE